MSWDKALQLAPRGIRPVVTAPRRILAARGSGDARRARSSQEGWWQWGLRTGLSADASYSSDAAVALRIRSGCRRAPLAGTRAGDALAQVVECPGQHPGGGHRAGAEP